MPCRYASSAPSAPSTGVQTLPQPRRDAMVIGERYVPDGRWKARWGSSHGEKCNRAITGTRLRKTMKYYPTHLDEGRGEMSRQGDDAEGTGGAAVPGPSSLPQESLAEKHTIQCLPPGPAPGTCPERRETTTPTWQHSPGHPPLQRLSLACPSSGSTTGNEWKDWGSAYNPWLAMTASSFPREIAAAAWKRPRVHHMPSVRSSLSGPGLGSGRSSSLPHPHSGPPAVRLGVWDGATLRSAGAPRDLVRGGRAEAADRSFPRHLFRGRDSSGEGCELASMVTAETGGAGRPVLDPGDGETSPDSEVWPREAEGSSN